MQSMKNRREAFLVGGVHIVCVEWWLFSVLGTEYMLSVEDDPWRNQPIHSSERDTV